MAIIGRDSIMGIPIYTSSHLPLSEVLLETKLDYQQGNILFRMLQGGFQRRVELHDSMFFINTNMLYDFSLAGLRGSEAGSRLKNSFNAVVAHPDAVVKLEGMLS